MWQKRYYLIAALIFLALIMTSVPNAAYALIQCPGDVDGDAVPDPFIGKGKKPNPDYDPNVRCVHLTGGDGYIKMADGRSMYIFGYADVTGIPESEVLNAGVLAAAFPSPIIILDEGQELYLTLTNVGMVNRPDLFDSHTIHFHGFPQAATAMDGVPEASIAINPGATMTYYYNIVDPGTYAYHCHMEATEHMQMGMLANLYVRPKQNKLTDGTDLNGYTHSEGDQYAYNDGDGSTIYDVEVPLQIGSFDADFHDASESTQPLPFALMKDTYPMLNGRGYPDTINPAALTPPSENGGKISQSESSLVKAVQGEKILLRISNLNVTRFYTLATLGIPMTVVAKDANLLRSSTGENLYYNTQSLTLGGGEAYDVILDTEGITPGTYFIYTTNLNYLNNNEEDFGGMMTEIHIQPAI
jgi:FtsP/CotA-like multicopper oxidase with cupredoxin domain